MGPVHRSPSYRDVVETVFVYISFMSVLASDIKWKVFLMPSFPRLNQPYLLFSILAHDDS